METMKDLENDLTAILAILAFILSILLRSATGPSKCHQSAPDQSAGSSNVQTWESSVSA